MAKKKKSKHYKNVVGFDAVVSVRFTKDQIDKISALVLLHQGLYKDVSHFIRVATIRRINFHLSGEFGVLNRKTFK